MGDKQQQPAAPEALPVPPAESQFANARSAPAASSWRESEQLYRRLVETSPDSIVLADIGGYILMANQQAVRLHGYSESGELLALNVMDLVAPEHRTQAAADIRRILETGGLRDRQHTLLRKDGSEFIGEVSGSLIRDRQDRPKYIIYNGRDITSRIRLHRETVETQKLESVGRLAGGIAHDFNNLLAVIMGNASLQLRNTGLPGKAIECLKDIVEAAERASTLTKQLLAYARGGLQAAVPSDLNELVRAAADILRPTLPKHIELVLNLADGLPRLLVDRSQIQQVIINLCMNSIQASPAPGPVEITTEIACLEPPKAEKLQLPAGRCAVLRVKDRGTGMDGPTVERMFEPFFTTRNENRGMGLPVSLGIVQSHGGRLIIHSEPGRGTEALVWLPATTPAESGAATAAPVTTAPQGTETILVLDPDPAVSRNAGQILASLGYFVVTRTTADETLAFLQTNGEDVDLLLLDPNLPDRAGREMLELVERKCPTLPVLLTGAAAPDETVDILLSSGAAGFVPKPFSIMSLAQAARRILDDPVKRKKYSTTKSF